METYEECCVRGYLPTCDLANTAVNIRVLFILFFSLGNNFRAFNFHGWNRPWNFLNNENFPIYGIYKVLPYLVILVHEGDTHFLALIKPQP